MANALILPLDQKRMPQSVGNKALNLHRLSAIGLRTPKTFVIPWTAFLRYTQDDISLVDDLKMALEKHIDSETAYAVRSSANIEDELDRSFAGQFKSVLDARSVNGVLQSVWAVWGSAHSSRVLSYLEQQGVPKRELLMGVIVQEMVPPVFAGVALSRNPVTGADEVVVEAVKGSGEALVQSGVTPYRWINKWGNWIGKPQSDDIPLSVVEEVVLETNRIANELGSFVDLEWVYDGENIYWLQVREITTINRRNVYSNHIPKEMIPGMIKPLIFSVNLPLVCTMWVRLITEMIGKTEVKPQDLAKSFYYRVYFNMGTLGQIFQEVGMPADSVEILMGLVPDDANKPGMKPTLKTFFRLPWLLLFLFNKWFFDRRMRKVLPQIKEGFKEFDYRHAGELGDAQLFNKIDRLYDEVQNAAYYNIITPLIAMMCNRFLKTQLAKIGVDLIQLDLMRDAENLLDYDPNYHLHSLHSEYCQLDEDTQAMIRTCSFDDFLQLPDISDFHRKVEAFLDRFGHLSDNGNDFSFTPWRETPDMVLDMIVNFLPKAEDSHEKLQFDNLKLRGFKRFMMRSFYRRAKDFSLLREQISSHYTYGYGLFRYYYLALGAHLVRRGLINDPEDIYYLEDSEIRQLFRDEKPVLDPRQVVSRHKTDIERFKDISLPGVIYGDEAPPVTDPSLDKLVGIPTSIGHYTGKVTLVRGIQDFNKVQDGDVLVIPYSEVSWTPLFARAGGVVAESGGLLSHSSIVAREYNIPAVVSVDGAMRLSDDIMVTVNGHTGEVIIHKDN